MQCACAILLSVACQAVPYFSTLSHVKKNIEHKMYDLIFSTNLSETLLILRRTERDSIK